MKAIRIHEDGGPEVLRYEDAPDPEPREGEALVELRAASLNHLDVWVRKGLPSVPKPRILGADGAEDARLRDGREALADPDVEMVERRGAEADEYLAVAGDGVGRLLEHEHLGAAVLVDPNRAHRGRLSA